MGLGTALLGAGMTRRFQHHLDRLQLPPGPGDSRPVTAAELHHLPEPAQRYLRFMGVPDRPRDWSFRARFLGEFRMRPEQKYSRCEAWQYNTALGPARVYYMRIDLNGVLPMFGTDIYVHGHGRMRGKLLGLVPVADGSGVEFDIGELTTYVNDALMLAPSMLLTPQVRWTPVDGASFDVTLTDGASTSTSRVRVDQDGRMVSVSSSDRWAALPGGLTRARWRTPIAGWTEYQGRRVPTGGSAVWQLDAGDFAYVRGAFPAESLAVNVPPSLAAAR